MESVLDRAARVLAQHPAPALPLDQLRRLVGGSGVAVAEEALLRALRRGSDRFRLVDPWRGPWGGLRAHGAAGGPTPVREERRRRWGARRPGAPTWPAGRSASGGACPPGRATRNGSTPEAGRDARGSGPIPGVGRPWVVARPRGEAPEGPAGLRRLRQSLAHLGWTVDDGSPLEMARWCRLLEEEGRVRERARDVGRNGGPREPARPPGQA